MDTLKQQLKDNGYKGEFDLASLLEACGEDISLDNLNGEWRAQHGFDIESQTYIWTVFGSTPEEAVANLWLELNEVKQS